MKSKSKSYKKKPITKVVERAFKNIEKQFTLQDKDQTVPKQKAVKITAAEEPHCSCCEAGCSCCTHPSGRIVGCHCRCTQTMHV